MTQEQLQQLRQELSESFKNRAMLYYLIFDELRKEVGAEKAEEVMTRAIYARGLQKANKYARYAPDDLEGLQSAFVGGSPDEGRLFRPEVMRCDAEGLDIKFHSCPLREAWQEAGLADEEVATICRIAARVDNGTFEGAGFDFSAETWQPGGDGCCYLHIRPGTK